MCLHMTASSLKKGEIIMAKLILLCGIPGSVKSTYAKDCVHTYGGIHISSDSIRKELYGDESIQGNPEEVFAMMHKRTVAAIQDGKTVYYDATNMTRWNRASIIAACSELTPIECHIVWQPLNVCIERDAARARTAGEAVILKMVKRFQTPCYNEGFSEIKLVKRNASSYTVTSCRPKDIPNKTPWEKLSQ